MNIHGYELISEWKNCNVGQKAFVKRGGKTYFIKKYQTPKRPINNGALDAKTIAHNNEVFDRFMGIMKGINTALREVSGSGGNIIVPADEFEWDNQYVEVSEFIEGAIPDAELEGFLSTFPLAEKEVMMKTAASTLNTIHKKGIVHSDLKLTNILVAKSAGGRYVTKIIDFDCGYFVTDIPDPYNMGFSPDYVAPELFYYSQFEEDWDDAKKAVGTATDIFSLGLIYHYYLSGELPHAKTLNAKLEKKVAKGKVIYVCEILQNGCEIELSDKITSLKYKSLIMDMLNPDPTKRPNAAQVLFRLKEPEPTLTFALDEPWAEDKLTLFPETIKKAGYLKLKKKTTPTSKVYELMNNSGATKVVTASELIALGFATKVIAEEYDEPWGEHAISFDKDKIKSRGFIAVKRATIAGKNGYELFRADGSKRFFNYEMLVAMGYALRGASSGTASTSTAKTTSTSKSASTSTAKPTGTWASMMAKRKATADSSASEKTSVTVEESCCEPWEEHGINLLKDNLKAKGFVKVERETKNGVNGYNLITSDGKARFMTVGNMIMLKFATKI